MLLCGIGRRMRQSQKHEVPRRVPAVLAAVVVLADEEAAVVDEERVVDRASAGWNGRFTC